MKKSIGLFILAGAFGILSTGCRHQQQAAKPQVPPTPTQTAPAPVANINVSPENVERGQSAQLSWNTQNASTVTIEGIGTVSASGSKQVTAQDSTTYHLVAKGDGGSAEADARLTVSEKKVVNNITDEELFAQNIKDIFFSYDNAAIRQDESAMIDADAKFLASHPDMKMVIEGHCDERGSEDYNMALGDNRAKTVRDALIHQGISADRIKLISLGKEKPFCTTAENESCWSQNRRAHFVMQKQQVSMN